MLRIKSSFFTTLALYIHSIYIPYMTISSIPMIKSQRTCQKGEIVEFSPDPRLKTLIFDLIDRQYNDSEDPNFSQNWNPLIKNLIKEKIRSTQKAPCQIVALAEESLAAGFRGINDDSKRVNFNCHDSETSHCDISIDLRGIWQYGCWCNFGNSLMNGKGAPVSKHDEACKRMQQCLRCAEIDGVNGGYDCNPRATSYNSTYGQSNNGNSFNSGCAAVNPDNLCGAHVCTCETQLINDILALVWEMNAYDPTPRHTDNPFGGDFDPSEKCFAEPGEGEVGCCGSYPFRSTFNTQRRSCCEANQRMYNPVESKCCDNGIFSVGDGVC